MKIRFTLLIVAAFLSISISLYTQNCSDIINMQAIEQVTVAASNNPDPGLSGSFVLRERARNDDNPDRHISGFVKFDISSIGSFNPEQGDIANLSFQIDGKLNSSNFSNLKAARVTGGDWSSTNPPNYSWATASRAFGNGSQVNEYIIKNYIALATPGQTETANVTDIVNDWIKGGHQNYGFGIFLTEAYQGISISNITLSIDRCTSSISCNSYTEIAFDDFENGWGIWNDGGNDCKIVNKARFARSGSKTVRLRNSSSSSIVTSDVLDLSSYTKIKLSFGFVCRNLDSNLGFSLAKSEDGGNTFEFVDFWYNISHFYNKSLYTDFVELYGPFSSNVVFKFELGGFGGNADKVHLDDIRILACANGTQPRLAGLSIENTNEVKQTIEAVNIYPNPAKDFINLKYDLLNEGEIFVTITSLNGNNVFQQSEFRNAGMQQERIRIEDLSKGIYIVTLYNKESKDKFYKKLTIL